MEDPRDKSNPADFCVVGSSEEYRLSRFERLTLVGGMELEKALGWLSKQLANFSYLDKLGPIDVNALKFAANYYRNTVAKSDLASFFQMPDEAPVIDVTPVHGLKDGNIVDLRFCSSYQVQNPDYLDEYSSYLENQNVFARMWKHNEKAKATVVAIHGWTMGDQRINSLAFQPGFFYSLGLDIVLVELPFHGRRKPKVSNKIDNLSLFPSNNIVRTNESMAQAISDLRQLFLWLSKQGVENIGCLGMSLGSYVSSLWASLDPLSFCIPIVPMSSMKEMAWEVISRHPNFTKYKEQGLSRDLLEDLYFMHSPLNHEPLVARDRALIIAGIGDKILPARQPKLLWDHWQRPQLHWFNGGHVTHFKRSTAFGAIYDFLKSLGYVN